MNVFKKLRVGGRSIRLFPDVETLARESGATLEQIGRWQTIAFLIVISPLMAAIVCALIGEYSAAAITSAVSGTISYLILR